MGVVVYRWEAPLFFANAGIFRQEIRKLVRRRNPRWVVLQCEAITDIDVTAADMLDKLDLELNAKGVNVVFVEMRSRIAGPPRALRPVRHASTESTSIRRSTRRCAASRTRSSEVRRDAAAPRRRTES